MSFRDQETLVQKVSSQSFSGYNDSRLQKKKPIELWQKKLLSLKPIGVLQFPQVQFYLPQGSLTKKELPKTYMHRDDKTFLKYNFLFLKIL